MLPSPPEAGSLPPPSARPSSLRQHDGLLQLLLPWPAKRKRVNSSSHLASHLMRRLTFISCPQLLPACTHLVWCHTPSTLSPSIQSVPTNTHPPSINTYTLISSRITWTQQFPFQICPKDTLAQNYEFIKSFIAILFSLYLSTHFKLASSN